MKKILNIALLVTLLVTVVPTSMVVAQGDEGADYIVQADDWLSKLADKFYGNANAYWAIMSATNQANEDDPTYAKIENPDVIEVGIKLRIPSTEEAQAFMADFAGSTSDEVRIGYVVHVTGIEFTAIVEEGARDAAEDYGVELVFTGPPNVDHAAQIAAFDSLLETDLDGIVFIAADPSVWEEPVQRAVDKGIMVLTADADAPNTARHAFFGVDAEGLGNQLGTQVREMMGDAGKIVLGECVIGPEPHILRENGFRAAFEGADIDWVGPVETVCDSTQNLTNWQNAYTANQDADALVGLTAVETPSLGKIKEETGGDFVVASFDPGAEGLRQMLQGNVDVTVGQNPYLAGYLPVQAIVRHVREGLEIKPGVNLYPGESILPEDAEGLIEREGGGQARTDWYKDFIATNGLEDFGLE